VVFIFLIEVWPNQKVNIHLIYIFMKPHYFYLPVLYDRSDFQFPLHQNMDHFSYQFVKLALLFLPLFIFWFYRLSWAAAE